MATKKTTRTQPQQTTLRHIWLAGLGAVAIVRREALNAANDAAAKAESLKRQAGRLVSQTQANLRDGIASAREQGEARADQFSAEVEARLAPVLVKLGLRPKPKARPRTRKTGSKTAAKRTRAPARKPAAKSAAAKPAGRKRAAGSSKR
ncbi:phasin family protein [Pseudoxanthomonas wuyuanensis]|uniref:Poly(Hydroxyalcanoate) granule associated protein (Phasin) n=1 Tax=Pseudoxanthomonas wuyuanensis TaxID=1073196 RepID=A0A286CZY5_9GAMM|nr:phasin family protein [Pseudoxanthomonas wuyuanensis]SOD51937.1 Poly(hydroxyalcanoate) granule associated protein (phasin) [Pseudoxanthomonas wuyuanensis]